MACFPQQFVCTQRLCGVEQSRIDGLGLLLRLDLRGHGAIVGERLSLIADSVKESVSRLQK